MKSKILAPNGEIVNAVSTPLSEATLTATNEVLSLNKLRVFPNPTSNIANIEFQLDEENEVSIQILDVSGKLLSSNTHDLLQGQHLLPIRKNQNWKGLYFVKVRVGQEYRMVKIVFE